jgi:hypothetical protein
MRGIFASLDEVRDVSEPWRHAYHTERSHESLGRVPPLTFLPRPTTARDRPPPPGWRRRRPPVAGRPCCSRSSKSTRTPVRRRPDSLLSTRPSTSRGAREVDDRAVDSSSSQPVAIEIPIPSPEIVLYDSARAHSPQCVVASPVTRFRSPAVESTALTGGLGKDCRRPSRNGPCT